MKNQKSPNIQELCLKILKKHGTKIKSIMLDQSKMVVIASRDKNEIKKYVNSLGLDCEVRLDLDCMKEIFNGDREFYETLRSSEIVYDPKHFIDPVKEMIISGKMHGTREATIQRFISIGEIFKKIDMIKHKILDNMYTSCVELSQALIIEKKGIICKPKEIVKKLKRYFVDTKILEKKYLEIAQDIIKIYKDIEHGKARIPDGIEIDVLQRKAEAFQERIIEILEKKI